jgi:hypothetical protein
MSLQPDPIDDELAEHFHLLRQERLEAGDTEEQATRYARHRLGHAPAIATIHRIAVIARHQRGQYHRESQGLTEHTTYRFSLHGVMIPQQLGRVLRHEKAPCRARGAGQEDARMPRGLNRLAKFCLVAPVNGRVSLRTVAQAATAGDQRPPAR